MKQVSSLTSNTLSKTSRPVTYTQYTVAFVFSVLFSMPAYAQNNYLFPSDIIDQGEQFQYDLGRDNRYESQRQWVYPNSSEFSERREIYPDANQVTSSNRAFKESQSYSNQGYSNQSFQNKSYPDQSFQSQSFKNHSYQNQDRQFKPSNLMLDNSWPSESRMNQGVVENGYNEVGRNTFDTNTSITNRYPQNNVRGPQYPGQSPINRYDSIRSQNPYTSSNYAQRPERQNEYVYPGDLNNGRSSQLNYNGSNPFSFDSFGTFDEPEQYQQKHNNENVQIRYIPVPVYTVPGTLPGTVPGVVTPGNMVPGYSHLSPSKNRTGLNSNSFDQNQYPDLKRHKKSKNNQNAFSPFTGLQYNPLSSMSSFSGNSNPFDSFYKIYDSQSTNTKPFSAPDFLIPGLSMPSMFSSQ